MYQYAKVIRQAGRQAGRRNKRAIQSGFTLIELVVVIVILGILSATALPKFIDLGGDARVAAVEGLKGAIWSAASMGASKCQVAMSTCNPSAAYNASPAPYITVGSQQILFQYGYPAAWDGHSIPGSLGIPGMLNLSGFTAKPYTGSSFLRVFTKDGAPTPDNCSVTYYAAGAGGPPTITTTITGC